ncbi:cohesin subunit SMC3 [Rhodotorula paludigena]|uniref:cohesin subunit SMC3 n=1 Tax=Rhodotorula paludigena TaxID=86838 RepID=UPI0031713920
MHIKAIPEGPLSSRLTSETRRTDPLTPPTRSVPQIQGFKSYRDETLVDPFSPGLNLLVGRNGSGKSNFFSAIRFVLSDAYTSLSREERQALLHDGGGAGTGQTMSAYVEVEFDNSDGRFPTNKPTLLLRRTIGLKKDEYQLDRKSTSKGEVMSLLESAGFSRSNPYYIVPQGRITHLTNQKDADRLLLLKEVAGTKVYEERRAESQKIMDETNSKRDKIKDLLEYIQERLDELEEEKEELKQFQTHDRARRSLEYCIYQRELQDVGDALDQIEEERRRDVDSANSRRDEFNAREKQLATLADSLTRLRETLSTLATEHRDLSSEKRELTRAAAALECTVDEAEDRAASGAERRTAMERDVARLEGDIAAKERALADDVAPKWEQARADEQQQRDAVSEREVTLRQLFAKQGRKGQFGSQRERDEHLAELVRRNEALLDTRRERESALEAERKETARERDEAERRRVEARKELEGRKERMHEMVAELNKLKTVHADKSEQRKELWKEDSKLSQQARNASDHLKTAQSAIGRTMDRDTANGLRAARAIADEMGLEGYYGPLYELFEVEDRYKTAVEVTAGTSLWQVVVDTDETATQILDRMVRDRSGRLTFIPLNRVRPPEVEYPRTNEAIPMINKLKFAEQFRPAFKHVFGRTIICQTLEIAGAYTRSHGLNAITLDGDKYDRKGSLTGGYHDVRRSRLDAVKALRAAQRKDEELREARTEVVATLQRLDQEVTHLVGQIQVAEGKLRQLDGDREPLVQAVMRAQEEEDRARAKLAHLEQQLATHRSNMRALEKEVEMWKDEMASMFAGEEGLTDEEEATMKRLTEEVEDNKKRLVELSKAVADLAKQKNLLEIELNENLRRRRDELRTRLDSLDETGDNADQDNEGAGESLEAQKNQLKRLRKQIEALDKRVEEMDEQTDKLGKEIAEAEKEREKLQTQQSDDQRGIARQQKNVERYLAKRQVLMQRKDECNKNIRDLGVLPEEAFAETTASSEKLLKKLRKVNEALKGFAHVNKKAYEQYTSFTKQRDELIARQEELDQSQNSIEELIQVLDARKDEAIERTFKQVAKNFSEVFEKLVPTGRGRLIMLQRQQERNEDDMDVDEPEEEGSVENYTGVAIRVSFKSKSNEGLRLQQLSGGQKALVALALIFSIQKCDPAPFYLFDEIDANLDADRRTAVAAMIDELSQEAQYICTTFRAELIPHADAYFGVVFNQAKISNVKTLTTDECSTFIEAAEQVRA